MTKKDVPADNPGLAKLPTKVRNRMGYKQGGGKVTANSMGRGVNLANGGRIVYKDNGEQIGGNPTRGTTEQGKRAFEGFKESTKPSPLLAEFHKEIIKEEKARLKEKGGEMD